MSKVDCTRCPLRRRSLFDEMSETEVEFMRGFKAGELQISAGSTIVMEGANSPQLFTVLEGMGTRYKTLENGRRQVVNFVFPGDFIGLQAGLMGEMKHSAMAATEMKLCAFNRDELWRLFRNHPDRAYDLTWMSAVEEHFLGETLLTLGQRDAEQRIAWALLRIFQRLQAVGLEKDSVVPMPFRQQDLADSLGLSLVHTNKTLARLRQRGLARWTEGSLKVAKPDALAKVGLTDADKPERRPLI
ncbi:Crp/Fnr family transcriptional regulator [Acidimangrovimonas sediminis]|uniref:Crp/Fnr family transcriptional regulator n=1 Tax=Acidimangrovimonas sediminis TaxID=2056283 RepID=UPI000C7FE3BE|nr:Crp/Fnr family transcriptional regulator [Acidimangrovimonas sediminis]